MSISSTVAHKHSEMTKQDALRRFNESLTSAKEDIATLRSKITREEDGIAGLKRGIEKEKKELENRKERMLSGFSELEKLERQNGQQVTERRALQKCYDELTITKTTQASSLIETKKQYFDLLESVVITASKSNEARLTALLSDPVGTVQKQLISVRCMSPDDLSTSC